VVETLAPWRKQIRIMSYKFNFGKYEGKSFEWLFFNAPWYAVWMIRSGIHRQEHNMDEVEGNYFRELYRRACNLGGTCSQCLERPLTRMGLSRQCGNDCLGTVGLYCDECEYIGGSPTEYYEPSFFAEDLPRCGQLRIVNEIRRHYIGTDGNLTQKRMEAFFHNDADFRDFTPGFFTREEAAV
jgi:hypothetical protein